MVSATNKIVSAISLGVFWRFAPSTMAIMRSKKASPGLTVTRTTIQSDNTCVPPVTALKSPPDSRITGADSPVMADSFTEAMPSTTSPSAGMVSPASTKMMSPLRKLALSVSVTAASCFSVANFLATTFFLDCLNAAACALLRPSANASAKLENSTVNHNQIETSKMNPAEASPLPNKACKNSSVVKMLPKYTTNITGLRHWVCGLSFLNESTMAGVSSLLSNIDIFSLLTISLFNACVVMINPLNFLAAR